MCRSSWWYVFGDKDARDKQVRGGEGREEEELLGEEEEEGGGSKKRKGFGPFKFLLKKQLIQEDFRLLV